jgi:large subunit ribosomal protein L33
MAKPTSIKVRLNSSGDSGFFYVTKKSTKPRQDKKKTAKNTSDKLVMRKYDPKLRKHVEFREGKIK